jgi:hypothetical protein
MNTVELYFRLAFGVAFVLAPGFLLAWAIGVRSVSAALGWSLTLLFGALTLTFLLVSSLTTAIALFAGAGVIALVALVVRIRGRVGRLRNGGVPGRLTAAGAGLLLGLILWHVAGKVQGDGLFHLARVRKLLAFDDLTLHRVIEFKDGGLHPGYAFPLWHGVVAVVARIAGVDPTQAFLHAPSFIAPLAIVIAYEAGWALFRSVWAAGAVAGAQAGLVCFAPGHGGAYVLLSQPEPAARHLLVPAALALALESLRAPSVARYASTGAAALALAVVHPTYALFLWIPFVGFLAVRVLWERADVRPGLAAFGALGVPTALFIAWLVPVVGKTASVTPSAVERARAIAHYRTYLDVGSGTSYHLAPEVLTRTGPIAIVAIVLFPLACLAARRRWAAFVAGGSLAVLVVCLTPLLFTHFSDAVSLSQSRRVAGFFPFAFAFAGGLGVLSRFLGPVLPSFALVAGAVLEIFYPGDFQYALKNGAPGAIVWVAFAAGIVALFVGLLRRGEPLEANAGFAAALFLLPVVVYGLARWTPVGVPPLTTLSSGLVDALRTDVPAGAVVYSDQETSYRLAAYAPVYIAVAPPGHVADTKANDPYGRARAARAFNATGNLAIPRRYGADYLVVDRLRLRRAFALPVLYRDARFVLYRLSPS